MSIYWIIVVAVIIFGMILPQDGRKKKQYIIVMAALHAFVCGFRYKYLTGDLLKYAWEYSSMSGYGWFSDEVFHEGRNAGFYWLMKLISMFTNGNFQLFLILLAIITEVIVAVLVFRYSPKPWLSYLVWNCMGFYVFGFSSIKQALAMAILMCASMCIFEEKPGKFLIFTLLAGFIHMPALCFLPAYWLAKQRINVKTVCVYLIAAAAIFFARAPIVTAVSEVYYENPEFGLTDASLGGRFFLIVLILITGIAVRGFRERRFEALFNLIIISAIFQMFSGFDNVFSRLADYYFQFTVLFIPMIFYESENVPLNQKYFESVLPSEKLNMKMLAAIVAAALIWWYYRTCIGVTISYAVDDYTNYRFMWEV